jgi:hypothetical protein
VRVWAAQLSLTLGAVALLGFATTAAGNPPPPSDLRVEGGEEIWRPGRTFRVVWANPATGGSPIAAVRYRVRSPGGGTVLGPTRIGWPATSIEGLQVPAEPGAYTAEVWLEDAAGDQGAPAAVKLRFDDARPGPVQPLLGTTWFGRAAFPLRVRLSHPGGEPPVSGIRGYAVSIAAQPGRSPCAASDRCADAEVDLRGGVAADSYVVDELPEGTSYLQAVAVSGAGVPSPVPGSAVLRVDKTHPVTGLRGLPSGWTNHPVRLTATAIDAGSGMTPDNSGAPPFTAIAIDGAAPATAAGPSVEASVIGEGAHQITYYARDLAGNVGDGGTSNGVRNPPAAAAVVRIDRRPPSVSFLSGQSSADPELIRVRIADAMSGADPARGWIGLRSVRSSERFERLPAAIPNGGELRARWNSDAYPDGEYEFRAVGYDRAGNAMATSQRADGAPMVLVNPLKTRMTVDAGLGSRRAQELAIPYGRGILFGGRLLEGTGTPGSTMPVRIVERFAPGADPTTRISTVTTDRRGAFAIRLDPGPSREVTAVFDGTATLTRASSSFAHLGIRGAVRLRVSAVMARVGGRPVVFAGRVDAAPGTIPAGGKSVQLEFRAPGLPWSEFRTIQTDHRGRFRYAYRFSDDDSRGVRFQFRAFAPAQDGWPYEPAGSRPVAVRGR